MNDDVFLEFGVDEVRSPPQLVDERDIRSSTRTVYNTWYVDKLHEKHTMTFNTRLEAELWLLREANRYRE